MHIITYYFGILILRFDCISELHFGQSACQFPWLVTNNPNHPHRLPNQAQRIPDRPTGFMLEGRFRFQRLRSIYKVNMSHDSISNVDEHL